MASTRADQVRANGVGRTICALAIAVAVACIAPEAQAQQNSRLSSKSVEAYSELLGLDADQREIAYVLHSEYMIDVEAIESQRREAVTHFKRDVQSPSNPKGDPEIRTRMYEITSAHENEAARVEASFFQDLRLMLDEEQAAIWPRVERLRRRETALRSGWYSGDGIDLIALTKRIAGERDVGPDVKLALETYELQIDRAIVTKARELKEMVEAVSDPKRSLDQSDYEEMGRTKLSVGLHVRDVNRRHARVIEALLAEDLGAAFYDEFMRLSFPKIYRTSRTDRLFRAATVLSDLSSSQRASMDELLASYMRERKAADQTWASAITEREDRGGQAPKRGRQQSGDEPVDPVEKARDVRQGVDERYERKVMKLLTPAQQQSLPSIADPEQLKGKGGGKDW